MIRLLGLLVLLGAFACRAAPPPAQGAEVERGSFAFVARGDTTVLEEYWRSSSTLRGTVRPILAGAKFGWARYHVVFSPAGDAIRADLVLGRVGTAPESPPVDSLTTTLAPAVIIEEWPNRSPTQIKGEHGVIPLFGPSMAMFQEVIRRAHRLSGGRGEVEIPVYALVNRPEVRRVHVTWITSDTAEVRWPGQQGIRYVVDPHGRVASAQDRNGEFTTIRLR